MISLDAAGVAGNLPYDQLIEALAAAFASDVTAPRRQHLDVPVPGGVDGNLLLMPAWRENGGMGVKIATIFPGNSERSLPSVFASYVLMSAETGVPVALLDGGELTLRRTAATSALASRYLSRQDARTLLMVGTGKLAPHLIAAHCIARPVDRVLVWGRDAAKAAKLAADVGQGRVASDACTNLDAAIAEADIVSCATLSVEPLLRGELLRPGQHLDLVGAFRADMREADSEAMRRARIFVDTREGAFAEAGDVLQAIDDGVIDRSDVIGELADLAAGNVQGRTSDDEITAFKSVGAALEDLTAAELTVRNAT